MMSSSYQLNTAQLQVGITIPDYLVAQLIIFPSIFSHQVSCGLFLLESAGFAPDSVDIISILLRQKRGVRRIIRVLKLFK